MWNPLLKIEFLREGRGARLSMMVVFYNAILALITIMIMLVNAQSYSEGYYYEPSTSRFQFIIITTIQKLATFIKKNPAHEVYDKCVVIIFDECHRSQFGDMHAAITKKFKKYHLFGFTGTPIFAINSGTGKNPNLRTTAQAFGDQLHSYTIVDAINDKNVLPFRVDYIKTMDKEEDIEDVKVWDIDREKAYMSPKRIALVTSYIL